MSPKSPKDQCSEKPLVFISHAHQDEQQVRSIKDWLEATGCSCWASWEKCTDRYREEIDAAIIKCNVFLLIGSISSFQSKEVKREVVAADLKKKPLVYYKIDGASHLDYPGFLTILGNKQFIQATNQSAPEQLKALAKAIYEAWGKDQTSESIADRDQLIIDLYEQELQKLNRWRDQLWALKLDSKGRAKRSLSNSDRATLRSYAQDLKLYLSVEDEEASCKPKKGYFYNELRSIVAKGRIDKRILSQIEKNRIKCFISRNTAVQTLEKLLTQNDYLTKLSLSQQAYQESAHWLVESVANLKSKSNVDCDLDPNKQKVSDGSQHIDKTSRQTNELLDSSIHRRASPISPFAEINKHNTDCKSENSSKSASHRQDNSDLHINDAKPIKSTNSTKATSGEEDHADQSSSSRLSHRSPSFLYRLEDLPSSLLKPVQILVHEIAESHPGFTNLMTSSEELKRQTAAQFNIHKDHAHKLIILARLVDDRGFDRQILVSTNYLSIAGQRLRVLPYHFPLVIENPARRIVMTHLDRSSKLVFGYSPKFGSLEIASEIHTASQLFTKSTSELFKWLLILLESSSSSFSDSSNLTQHNIGLTVKAIECGRLNNLDFRYSLDEVRLLSNEDAVSSERQASSEPIDVNDDGTDRLKAVRDWRDHRCLRMNKETSNSELQQLQAKQFDIVSKLNSQPNLHDILRDFDEVSGKTAIANQLVVHPTEDLGSPSEKAKALHGLKYTDTGKLLLHLNVGRIRGGSGMLIFMNGFSMCSGLRRSGYIEFGTCMDLSASGNLRVSKPSKDLLRVNLKTRKNGDSTFSIEYTFRSPYLSQIRNLSGNVRNLLAALDSRHRASEVLARLVQAEWRLAFGYLELRRYESLTMTRMAEESLAKCCNYSSSVHNFLLQFTFSEAAQPIFMVLAMSGVFLCGVDVLGKGVRPTPAFIKWESLINVYTNDEQKLFFATKDMIYALDLAKFRKHRPLRSHPSVESISELARFTISLRERFASICWL